MTCTPCAADADCGERVGLTLCDPTAGACVAPAGLCESCTADVQCASGQLCVPTEFAAEGTITAVEGWFCLWVEGGAEGGGGAAPSSCSSEGRPHIRRRPEVVSRGGITATVCDLRVSTCQAQLDADWACTLGDDASCGEATLEDAYCVDRDLGTGEDPRCASRCATAEDCVSGIGCNTTLGVCQF